MAEVKDYMPRSAGVSAGDKGDDVDRLQKYLRKFGYFDTEELESFGASNAMAEPAPSKDGVFEDSTKLALQRFQQFHNLPITGELDVATLDEITKPRCGFPDTADFVADGRRWTTTNLRYGFQNFTSDLTVAQVRGAIVKALRLWSAYTPLTFTEVPLTSSPEVVIRFVAGDHGDGSAFDGPSGVLAHAFYPPPNSGALAGDAHFDEAETWTVAVPPAAGTFDLVTVAAHEFGHALGLAHSTVQGSLMYPTYGGPHRWLHNDDARGIASIYGWRTGWRAWEDLGGIITSDPAVSSWAPGRLDCFARGTDNAMWHKWFQGGWSGWESLGGVITSAPDAVSWGPGRIDCFARGTNNALWHRWFQGGWSGWENLGGVLTSGPAVCSWGAGRLDVFVRGTDNALWHKWFQGGWSGWESLGGTLTSDPAAVCWGPGRIDVFVRGTDNALWHKWFQNSWSGWESLGGVLTSAPAASSWGDHRLDVFVRGGNNALYNKWYAGSWEGYGNLGGVLTSGPAAVSWDLARIDVFARGTNNHLWHRWYG